MGRQICFGRKLIMKKLLLLVLVIVMTFSLCACGKSEAVVATEEAIAAIGTVDYDSLSKIETAEKLYSILTDSEKEKVENRIDLVNAREAYEKLPPKLPEFKEDEILALYAASTINDYLLDVLKDPGSLVVHSLNGGLYENNTYIFEFDYSAKNSFGGNVRDQLYIAVERYNNGFSTITYGDPNFYGTSNQSYTHRFYQNVSPVKSYDTALIYEHLDDLWSYVE